MSATTEPTATASVSPTPTAKPDEPAPAEQPLSIVMILPSNTGFRVLVQDANAQPVRTDLWLYLASGSTYVPFSEFTIAETRSRRRSGNFLLPAEILGTPTQFAPADNGGLHGFMSDGADRASINGYVDVTLNSALAEGSKILVAAALEDQRYYGAKVFTLPSGTPEDAPMFNQPEQHIKRTYEHDIKPLLKRASCMECHSDTTKVNGMLMNSYDDMINRNIYQIGSERFVEPGAPGISPLARRSRPGIGTEAKKWYGKSNRRWHFDLNGQVIGDRRMPPQDVTGVEAESDGNPTYFDIKPQEYKVLYDWIAQGAPEN